MRRLPAAAAATGTVAALLAAAPAQAEVIRYALVIGANRGHADERDLRYAERDAERMADTLTSVGGVAPGRVVRLLGASPAEVRAAALDLNLVIQRDLRIVRDRRGQGEVVLLVYYSGHGDARNLHLGPDDLPLDELAKLVRLSEAKLKILIVDACRSGGLTRVKGGRPVAPFQIASDDRLQNEGYAVITSSAAGEDAQESETLQSSIFTHFFRSALLGSGDTNKDRRVTLGEAYAYAYEETLKASMRTVAGFQHATFDFDLRGRADPVLTDLTSLRNKARLILAQPGDYLVMLHRSRSIAVEANTRTSNVTLVVPAERYIVHMRGRTTIYETEIHLKGGDERTLGPATMNALPYAMVVRKGGTALRLAQGPHVAGIVHGPLGDGFSPMMGAQVGYAFDLPSFSLMPRVGLQGGASNRVVPDVASNRMQEISIELSALVPFDFGSFSVAPLISGGIGLVKQTVRKSAGCAGADCEVSTNPLAGIVSVGLLGGYALTRELSITTSVELTNFILSRQESTISLPSWRLARVVGIPTYRAGLGLGYRF